MDKQPQKVPDENQNKSDKEPVKNISEMSKEEFEEYEMLQELSLNWELDEDPDWENNWDEEE